MRTRKGARACAIGRSAASRTTATPRQRSRSCELYHGPSEIELATGMLASHDERTALAKLEALAALGRQWLAAAKPGIVPPLPLPEDVPE